VRVPFLDIPAQYRELASELDSAVLEVLRSGAYVLGKHNRALEEELARRHGVAHGIAVNSGTDALRIMMDACRIGPGDEVITTAFTFVASVETIVQVGAVPVFVDIDPRTFNIDVDQIEAAITPRTRAIMPIHLFGQLADVRRLAALAEKRDLIVLEDAAQALGCHHEGTYAGNFGRAAGLSFYVTKNLGAAGDGGMILTNDDDVAERSRSLRVHGMGRERYYYDDIGYTSRLDEIQAAILEVKLQRLDAWNQRRSEIANLYLREMADTGVMLPYQAPGNNHTWHQFTIRTRHRDELQSFLKEREIDSMIYYPVPLHFHAPYRRYGEGEGSLPETEAAATEVLSLPIHPHLTDEQAAWVARCVTEFGAQVPTGR
jgi:dTDP-4-amino-4,6-dideoxygalactose transaminase